MYKNQRINRMCSFYVSNMHLSTMMLPYLANKLGEGNTIYTFLEENLEDEMKLLVSKLNLNEEIKKKITQLNWKKSNLYKYADFEQYMKKEEKKTQDLYVLVVGKEEYMERINEQLEKWSEKQNDRKNRINIIDCYEVMQFNDNISNILDKHNKIINTSGEKEIEDVFEGYRRENKKLV